MMINFVYDYFFNCDTPPHHILSNACSFVSFPRFYTLKTPGSEIDPEKVHWGQTPFRVNDDPEISQLDAECASEPGQSDPIICQVCRKLTKFRVIFDLEWSLAPMDPFPGHADPGVFRVYVWVPPSY